MKAMHFETWENQIIKSCDAFSCLIVYEGLKRAL